MENLKKVLGILWIVLALAAAYFCIFVFGFPKLQTGNQEDIVFGSIILFVLTPLISLGLATFGYFALTNQYADKNQ